MNKVYSSVFRANRSIQLLSKCSYSKEPCPSGFVLKDAPGLSKKIVNLPSEEVGFPRASKSACYKNPEYFCYHNTSFYEAEVEMHKFRLPQPSNKAQK